VKAYALTLVALLVALAARWLLDGLLGDSLPLTMLFGAIAVAVWVGGPGPAIAAAIVGYFAFAYLFVEPRGSLGIGEPGYLAGLIVYLITCAAIIAFGQAARLAHRRAAQREEILRVTLHSIGDAVITTDPEGRISDLNPVATSLTGWSLEEARMRPITDVFRIVNEETREPVENPAVRALREGTIVGLANHTLLIDRHGNERPIDDSAAPIRDEQGNVCGCVLIFRDVTRQRELERETARQLENARRLASIVESAEDPIIGKGLDGTIQSWNSAAERLFGYRAQEAIGRHVSIIVPEERVDEEEHILANLREGQRIEHLETERSDREGKRIHVSLTISPIKDEAGNIVGASKFVRDITARKLAEAERQNLITLVENSTDFIGLCDTHGRPTFINRAGLQLVGLESLEEARNTHVEDFFFPEDRAYVMQEFFPEVLELGHAEMDIRFRNFKTGEARWMAYKVVALKGADGRPTGFATVSQDITERRRLADDLRKLAADLRQADARKNEFLATLAHELRNPLAPLTNMLEVLKRASDADLQRRARDTMERQLKHLVRLVDDLLDLNRVSHNRLELRLTEVDLASVVADAVEASKPLADAAGHRLVVNLPSEPVMLRADPARLTQVLSNLLNNSCKYTPPNGSIWLTAERHGNEVVIAVKDNGVGIPRDKIESIFEMFTQLGPSQGGLGIGLTLVRQLVAMHGGTIEASSPGPGQGSEFRVRLPTLEAALL
jgi:PAS domain S-box-containing protein